MSPQSKAEPPNTTQEFPALDLTGLFDHSTPWHHADDEQIDFHLDQLEYASDLEDGHRLGQHEHSHQGLGSEYHSDTIAMALRSTDDQTNSPSTPAGEDPLVKTDDPGIAHDMSTHGQNAFDHLQYQMQNTQHTNDTGSEPKQEASLDTLTTSSNQQSSSVLNSDDIITSQAMHRHHTDPTPAANSIPPWQLYWPKERNQMASGVPERLKQPSGNRQKAATTPTSYPRQWQTQHSYAPTLPPSAPSYHVPATASQGNMSYHSHASPAHSSFGMNPYDPTMALNAAGYPTSLDNNNHHNSFANQHKTKRATPGMVRPSNVHHSPNLTQDHHHMLSVPQQFVLKSHVHDPNDIDVNTFTGMSQLHAAAMKQSPQGEMSELDNGFYEELEPDDELHYDSIEAARVAERQPARVNPKKDETIPWTNDQKRELVRRMVRCMSSVRFAQDNDGMIRQWAKLKLDEARVEQAAWRILGMVLDIHVHGIPMLPNKPSCTRYQKFADRWNAICEGLSTQKTMCKHLLGAEFTAQLVNDPLTATQRVTNNRKVNAGKKEIYSTGRQGLRKKKQKRGRASSSSSTQAKEDEDEEADLNGLGDEDADGETDEDYQEAQTTPKGRAATAQMTPKQGAGSRAPRVPKRERDVDDSEDDRQRPTKYLRLSIAQANRRASTKGANLTPKRKNDSRSQFQTLPIAGKLTMCDLNDASFQDVVYNLGTPAQQEIFTKIHFPMARQTHRKPRAAAPNDLREDREDDLHGIEDGHSGSNHEDGED